MKLVYKTDNLSRANKILAVLLKAGIKGSIQGKNSYGIREPAFRNVLSVWIHNNNDYINACKALETFYDSEIQKEDKTSPVPSIKNRRILWFLIALTAGILIGYYIWHITNHLS